jgi:predicted O-linked N-acetylglucosamine transferase (SPINDLY family)
MISTNNFKTANDNSALKQWMFKLDLGYYSCENLKFLLKWYLLSIIINDHAKDVSEFYHKYSLLDKNFQDFVENFFKELIVIV